MTRRKRFIFVGSMLTGLAGIGSAGYFVGQNWFGGESAPAAGEVAKPIAAPLQPIALAPESSSDGSPLSENPLRLASNQTPIVRGNNAEEGMSLPDTGSYRETSPAGSHAFSGGSSFAGGSSFSARDDQAGGSLAPPPALPPSGAMPTSSFGQRSPASVELPDAETPSELPPSDRLAGEANAEPQELAPATEPELQKYEETPAAEPAPPSFGAAAQTSEPPALNRFGGAAAGGFGSAADTLPPPSRGSFAAPAETAAPEVPATSAARVETPAEVDLQPAPLVGGAMLGAAAATTLNEEGAARPGAQTLEGAQNASLIVQKTAPSEVQVGKPAIFNIKVRNVGQTNAENVVLHDAVPQGTRLIDTTPATSQNEDGNLAWNLGTLRGGEEKTISMQLMPVAEGEIGSIATVSFSAQASARSISTRPQLVVESVAPKQVLIGQNVTLGIRLSNPGTGVATRVVLEEDVPEGLTHPAGRALEFEVGSLRPGETRELELTLKADKAGVLQNIVRARAEANLSSTSTAEIEVTAPDLALDIDGPSLRYLERQATHNITLANPGTAAAQNVEMVAHLPKGLKFVSANNQGQYDAASHAVFWSLEQLTASEKGAVSLCTLPVEAGPQKIRVESRADMGLAAAEEHEVSVEGLAALFFEVADAADPIEVSGETVYEVRVINQGSKTSTNVRVVAALPPALKPLEANGATAGAVQGQQVVFEPLARLAPKADALFRVRVQGLAAGNQTISVQLSSDEIPQGVTKEESTRVYADE